jgi:hypothetical protein
MCVSVCRYAMFLAVKMVLGRAYILRDRFWHGWMPWVASWGTRGLGKFSQNPYMAYEVGP